MNGSRAAAVVTWSYVAVFGIPAVPTSIHLAEHGRLPTLWGLFEMYGGPWSAATSQDRLTALLLLFAALTLAAAGSSWLLWTKRRGGAVSNLALLPVEAVFWVGFALPVPWLFGVARVVLIALAWRSPSPSPRHEAPTS